MEENTPLIVRFRVGVGVRVGVRVRDGVWLRLGLGLGFACNTEAGGLQK